MIAGQSWWDCFPGKSLQGCASVPENELSSWEVVGQTNHSTPIGGKWANKIPLFAAFTVRVCHFLWVHLVPISPLARVASCSKQNINFLLLHKHTHTRYLRWGLDKSRQIPSGNFSHIFSFTISGKAVEEGVETIWCFSVKSDFLPCLPRFGTGFPYQRGGQQ